MIFAAWRCRAASGDDEPAALTRSITTLNGGSFVLMGGYLSRSSLTTISAAAIESTMPRSSLLTALEEQRNVRETGRQATRFATSPRVVPLCTRIMLTATSCECSSIFRDEAGGCVALNLHICFAGSEPARSGSSNSRPKPPGSEKTTSRSPRNSRQQRKDLDHRRGRLSETSDKTLSMESEGTAASKIKSVLVMSATPLAQHSDAGEVPASGASIGSDKKHVPRLCFFK
mmetsp:Transcript_69365/g.203069  ORF Transcript_69365/g.203069 Transcript_69365/m.203069 type:complete len:230 (-) Transcript_69365:64-753(-)